MLDEVAQGEFALAARDWVAPLRDSFPDFQMEIVDLVADNDKVAAPICAGYRWRRLRTITEQNGGPRLL